ncbi:hypothetical protein FXO38_29876, partial [Capsicum annuum]
RLDKIKRDFLLKGIKESDNCATSSQMEKRFSGEEARQVSNKELKIAKRSS